MFGVLLKKELFINLLDLKFVVISIVCIALILLGVFAGERSYRTRVVEYTMGESLVRKTLEDQRNWAMVRGRGTKLMIPPSPLSALVTGVEESAGRVVSVNASSDIKLQDSKHSENPILGVFGTLDLTSIVTVVLSMFALVLTYDTVCGEKERGTLRLMLASAVPRDKIISAKIVGGLICTFVPILIGLLLGLVVLLTFPSIRFGGDEWIRLLLIIINFGLYLLVFFSLGLLVSSRTTRTAVSFLVLQSLWVLLVIIIPRAAVIVAAQLSPIPSAHEIRAQKDAVRQEVQQKTNREFMEYTREHQFDPDKGVEAFMEESRKHMEEVENRELQEINEGYAKIDASYENKRREQRQLAILLSRISPAALTTYAAMNLADTGLEKVDKFLSNARTYKLGWTTYINSKMFGRHRKDMRSAGQTKPGQRDMPRLQVSRHGRSVQMDMQTRPDLRDMPEFTFRSLSLRESFALAQWDFVIMFLFAVVLFLGAIFSFLRYDAT